MIEKAMASGMSASATTKPASKSLRVLDSHSWRKWFMSVVVVVVVGYEYEYGYGYERLVRAVAVVIGGGPTAAGF
jgi:hypothetical protein